MSQHQSTSASHPSPGPGKAAQDPPRHSEHSSQAPADPRAKAKEPPRAKHSPHTHTQGTGSTPLGLPSGIAPPASYQGLLLAGLWGWVGLEGLREVSRALGLWWEQEAAPVPGIRE